jgi:hypothetical protein
MLFILSTPGYLSLENQRQRGNPERAGETIYRQQKY